MTALAHYVHVHLAGAAAGIDLFGRSADGMLDRSIGEMVRELRTELVDERRRLRRMADELGVGESLVLTNGARVGERLGRLKPNGSLVHRTPLTDLVELEAMRTAVGGKRSGWDGLLSVSDRHDVLDAEELQALIDQADEQRRLLADAHSHTAARVLAPR